MKKLSQRQRIAWQWERAFIYVGESNADNRRFIKYMSDKEKLYWMSAIRCHDCKELHPVWVEFGELHSDYSPNQVHFPDFIKRCKPKFFKKYRFLFDV